MSSFDGHKPVPKRGDTLFPRTPRRPRSAASRKSSSMTTVSGVNQLVLELEGFQRGNHSDINCRAASLPRETAPRVGPSNAETQFHFRVPEFGHLETGLMGRTRSNSAKGKLGLDGRRPTRVHLRIATPAARALRALSRSLKSSARRRGSLGN